MLATSLLVGCSSATDSSSSAEPSAAAGSEPSELAEPADPIVAAAGMPVPPTALGTDGDEEIVAAPQAVAGAPSTDGVRGCSLPPGVSGTPRTIGEAVALLNALPKPTTIACLLESLDRPLEVYLTSSGLSAQPAPDARSPRTFLVRDQLILSVVPDGASAAVLELAFRTAPGRSIRAEIPFPLTADVTAAAMTRRVQIGRFSMCGGCHTNELRVADEFFDASGGAYESDVIAPFPPFRVDLQTFREEARACDPGNEPLRCANLSALFGHGEVTATRLWSEPAP